VDRERGTARWHGARAVVPLPDILQWPMTIYVCSLLKYSLRRPSIKLIEKSGFDSLSRPSMMLNYWSLYLSAFALAFRHYLIDPDVLCLTGLTLSQCMIKYKDIRRYATSYFNIRATGFSINSSCKFANLMCCIHIMPLYQ
jgi:hypothetical protein